MVYNVHMRTAADVHSYIVRRIAEARVLAGYNKVEMARLLNMVKSAYFKLEDGQTKFLDAVLLASLADATDRRLSFFLPDADRPDLAAAIKATYPDLTPEQVRDALEYVASLAALSQKKRTLRNELDALSSDHTEDTTGSQAGSKLS